MITSNQAGYNPMITNAKNPDKIHIKSAVTSKYAPNLDVKFNLLAKQPSNPSVIIVKINMKMEVVWG